MYIGTPMSARRVAVLTASLVCRVLSTRWPVIAARTPISAVWVSRISPSRITSGSWRSTERSTRAKLSSILSFTWIWVTPASRYSIGSSTVTSLRSSLRSAVSSAYSEVVLPEPVGPVTSSMPLGRSMPRRTCASTCAGMPMRSSDRVWSDVSSTRSTTDSPQCEGMIEIRMSIGVPRTETSKRPS